MKRLIAILALTLGWGTVAPAQKVYTGTYPAPPGGYSYGKQEPSMSINNSYLGYSNFTHYGPGGGAAYPLAPRQPRRATSLRPCPFPFRWRRRGRFPRPRRGRCIGIKGVGIIGIKERDGNNSPMGLPFWVPLVVADQCLTRAENTGRRCCSGWLGSVLRPQRREDWGRSTDPSHPFTFLGDEKRVRSQGKPVWAIEEMT